MTRQRHPVLAVVVATFIAACVLFAFIVVVRFIGSDIDRVFNGTPEEQASADAVAESCMQSADLQACFEMCAVVYQSPYYPALAEMSLQDRCRDKARELHIAALTE